MKLVVVKSLEQMGKYAASMIEDDMQERVLYVLGLATGSTPLPLYRELVRLHEDKGFDFSRTISFNLDEYVGLPTTHDQSYRYFMDANLFNRININKKNTHVPDGMAEDLDAQCEEYEEMISDAGGIDFQVLGIGSNGHIGFNEPGSSLGSRTRVVRLSETTIRDNSRFFKSTAEVPKQAITMGIATILEARKIVMLASGRSKADAVAKALEGAITAMVPASALQMHPDVTFVVTEDAASGLRHLR